MTLTPVMYLSIQVQDTHTPTAPRLSQFLRKLIHIQTLLIPLNERRNLQYLRIRFIQRYVIQGVAPTKKKTAYNLVPRYQLVKRGWSPPQKKIGLPLSTRVITGQGVVVPSMIWKMVTQYHRVTECPDSPPPDFAVHCCGIANYNFECIPIILLKNVNIYLTHSTIFLNI